MGSDLPMTLSAQAAHMWNGTSDLQGQGGRKGPQSSWGHGIQDESLDRERTICRRNFVCFCPPCLVNLMECPSSAPTRNSFKSGEKGKSAPEMFEENCGWPSSCFTCASPVGVFCHLRNMVVEFVSPKRMENKTCFEPRMPWQLRSFSRLNHKSWWLSAFTLSSGLARVSWESFCRKIPESCKPHG